MISIVIHIIGRVGSVLKVGHVVIIMMFTGLVIIFLSIVFVIFVIGIISIFVVVIRTNKLINRTAIVVNT
jgi:hypothetical protein